MGLEDDPEAFLMTFEWVVETFQWPQEIWTVRVAPLLIGEAQVTYKALGTELAKDYSIL